MNPVDYIMARISEGARVRCGMDYFGQPLVMVPRKWLPGVRTIQLTSAEMERVRGALLDRRARRDGIRAAPIARSPRRPRIARA